MGENERRIRLAIARLEMRGGFAGDRSNGNLLLVSILSIRLSPPIFRTWFVSMTTFRVSFLASLANRVMVTV